MAEKWCLEHGVLPIEKAKEVYDRLQNADKNNKKKWMNEWVS